jgi:CheY-like chemotaxis protein
MIQRSIHQPQVRHDFATSPSAASYLVPTGEPPDESQVGVEHPNHWKERSGTELSAGARNPPHDQPIRAPNGQETTTRKPAILVVDDDAGVRNLLNAVLWQQGFMIWLAGNGLHALELYQELAAKIDLVLMDVRMPGLDGPQTLAALQRLNPDVGCCFMTGDSGPYTEEELLARGAVAVLHKPFHLTEVAQLLRQLVTPEARHAAPDTGAGNMSELFLG